MAVVLLALGATNALAGGACCVVQVSGSERAWLSVSAVHAQSHEDVLGSERAFAQQGTVMRLSWRLGAGFAVSGTGGVPIRTDLEGVGTGYGGWIAGVGLSYSHRLWDPVWSTGVGVSTTRSEGNLGGSDKWILSELQGSGYVERDFGFRTSLHAGVRANLGSTELEYDGDVERLHSDIHPVGFAGWRQSWTPRLHSTLEVGYGHGFLVSLGMAFPLG